MSSSKGHESWLPKGAHEQGSWLPPYSALRFVRELVERHYRIIILYCVGNIRDRPGDSLDLSINGLYGQVMNGFATKNDGF